MARGSRAVAAQDNQGEAQAQAPNVLFVWDTTAALGAVRNHDVIMSKNKVTGAVLTRTYGLASDKACKMPAEHALQFLRDKAFVVSTVEDLDTRDANRVQPVKQRVEKVNVLTLSENETIAEWGELSTEALVRRAHAFPADEKPDVKASRAELIAFLVEKSTKPKQGMDKIGDVEEMPGDELDGLFGGDRSKGMNHNPMAAQ